MCETTRLTLFVEMGLEKPRRKGQSSIGRIKKAKSEYEKLEPSDVFSAVESLKALVVMTERVDKRGRVLVLAVFDVSRAHF